MCQKSNKKKLLEIFADHNFSWYVINLISKYVGVEQNFYCKQKYWGIKHKHTKHETANLIISFKFQRERKFRLRKADKI